MFSEVRVDLDFDLQHPCNVPIRLLRFVYFWRNLVGGYASVFVTGHGFHLVARVPSRLDRFTLLRVRQCFNDDYRRINLDWERAIRGLVQFDILFTYRVKTYDKYGRECMEKALSDNELDDVINRLVMLAEAYRRRVKGLKSMRRLLKRRFKR